MKISEEEYSRLTDRVVHEGLTAFLLGPLSEFRADLPARWSDSLVGTEARPGANSLWPQMEGLLPRFSQILRRCLSHAGVLVTDEIPLSVVYFLGEGVNREAYRARTPSSEDQLASSALPDDFKEFYRVHDGCVLYFSEDEGPLPQTEWVAASNLWPDVQWQIPPGDLSLGEVTIVYKSGQSLAFGYETTGSPPTPLVLYGNGTVDLLADMWTAIDDRMAGFLNSLETYSSVQEGEQRSHDTLRSSIVRCERLLHRLGTGGPQDGRFRGAAYYEQWSRLLLEQAFLQSQTTESPKNWLDLYRDALAKWCLSLERRDWALPQHLLDFHGLAHALGRDGDAAFLAMAPITMWGDGSLQAHQAFALFALERGDLENATLTTGQLLEMTFEGDTGPTRDAEIVCRLLESLSLKDSHAFALWRERVLDERPPLDSIYSVWIPWSLRIAAFDAVAHRLGIAGTAETPMMSR